MHTAQRRAMKWVAIPLVLLSIGCLALSACGDDSETASAGAESTSTTEDAAAAKPYPDIVRYNFLSSCQAQPDGSEAFCGCVLDTLESTVKIRDFIVISATIANGGPTPPEVEDARASCAT